MFATPTHGHKEHHLYGTVSPRSQNPLYNLCNTHNDQHMDICNENNVSDCRVPRVYFQVLADDLKSVTRRLSEMKHSLETDKPLQILVDNKNDSKLWNDRYQRDVDDTGAPPSWFNAQWLYAECYLYRYIHDAFVQRLMQRKTQAYTRQPLLCHFGIIMFVPLPAVDRGIVGHQFF